MKIEAHEYLEACRLVKRLHPPSGITTKQDITRDTMATVGQVHGALYQMHKGASPLSVDLVYRVRQLIRCAAEWQMASGMDFLRTHRMASVDMLSANIGRCAHTHANSSPYLMGMAERLLELYVPELTVHDLMRMDIEQVLKDQERQVGRGARVELEPVEEVS